MKLHLTHKKLIIFNEDVTCESSNKLIKKILKLDKTKGDIYLIISSSGGDSDSGFLIYKTLKNSLKNKLITIAQGEVASSATIVFLVGSKRYAYSGVSYYIHAGVYNEKIPCSEVNTFFKSHLNKRKDEINVYSKNSNISKKKWGRIINESRVFSSKQMVKYQLAHEAIED